MTRRRLILAIVAAVLCGVAWWLSLDRLSAEERVLDGTWTFGPKSASGTSPVAFLAHRPERPARRRAMVDMEQLLRIREQLNRSGRIREILDDEGKVLPSQSAMELVGREHAGKSEAERYSLAQVLTLLELADKYQEELK